MKFKCEINTSAMQRRIHAAAEAILKTEVSMHDDIWFEHGQWWVNVSDPNEDDHTITYSVVDAAGGRSVDGFDLEEI